MNNLRFTSLIVGAWFGLIQQAIAQDIIWDNGEPDGVGGVSNRSNPYRSLLDDFIVPDGQMWQLSGFQTWGVWNFADPPAGESFELTIWSHVEDHPDFPGFPGPDQPVAAMIVTGYDEQVTGQTWLDREEVSIVLAFEPHKLQAGKYWLEMHMLSGEAHFIQMERSEVIENSYWVNYEDFGGLQPSQEFFGTVRDLAWNLRGELVEKCPADLDDDGIVGLSDLLELLEFWGDPYGLADLLDLLAAWGPCP